LVTVFEDADGEQALNAPAAITAPPATRKSRLETSFFLFFSIYQFLLFNNTRFILSPLVIKAFSAFTPPFLGFSLIR
jgi:hypothetical protein